MKKVYLSLTGYDYATFERKFKEVQKFGINEICVFLSALNHNHHKYVLEKLLKSKIKYIPLVHICDKTTKAEIEFFKKNFKTKYFNIHNQSLFDIEKYQPHLKNILLETHPEVVFDEIGLSKIGGFCIDVAHFWRGKEIQSKDYFQVLKFKNKKSLFKANHLSGYKKNWGDLHDIKNEKDFEYLKDVPKFIFGDILAIEIMDTINTQTKVKKYIEKIIK